jgi:hypothetical protein
LDNIVRTDLAARFAPVVAAHPGGAFLQGETLDGLTLHREGRLTVAWAPFDHMSAEARLVIVGITPGRQQAENALAAFRAARDAGTSISEASRRAKSTGAFSGPMRRNLIAMANKASLPPVMAMRDFSEAFTSDRGLVHLTSALRYPVFLGGKNYDGTPNMIRTPLLRRMVETYLAEEVKALPQALWLPLGPKPAAALLHLANLGLLDRDRILDGLPHPSNANAERIAYFLGRKTRASLSAKTRPDLIDAARERLAARLARVQAAA